MHERQERVAARATNDNAADLGDSRDATNTNDTSATDIDACTEPRTPMHQPHNAVRTSHQLDTAALHRIDDTTERMRAWQ
jgi:hypothetical protein